METETERELIAQPPAKRMKLAVPVGVGGGEAAVSLRSRRLRQTLLVVLFLVRARTTVTASISQIGRMLRRYVDHAFHKHHELISSKLDSFQGHVESKLDTFQGQVEGLRQEVRQLASLRSNCHPDRHTRLEPNQEHAAANGSTTNIQLCFLNNWKPPIYTNKSITDENNAPIKVAVFGDDKVITTGPLSKAKIEILVLHEGFYNKCQDNWTKEEFDKHIVAGQDEQGLVLGTVWLTNGEVELSQIRFKEGSSRKKFIMAARICKSQNTTGRVREAIMNKAEKIKDRRNEPNEKSNPPRLNDDVYRLEMIARDGAYHKRLQQENIYTVQDFLKALNKNSDDLCEILQMKNKPESWSKLILHARERILEDRHELKAYQTEDVNVVLFFNCVHDIVGARFCGNYIACEKFDTAQKALVNKLKEHAYNRLEDIPSDYVMKGNAPDQISLGTVVAAGPSGVPADTGQPNSFAENLEASQVCHGTGAAENWPCNEIDFIPESIYLNANYGPMNTGPDDRDLNTRDCQGQGIPSSGQQQIIPPSTGPDWQQNAQGPMYPPVPFESVAMGFDMFPTSAQLNFVPHHLPQLYQTAPAAAPAWMMVAAAQPPFAEQAQGPGCSTFPGSGHGNDI